MNLRERLGELFDAWRAGDALRSSAFFAPDARYSEAGHETLIGRAAIVQHFTRFFRDGPRFDFDVDETLCDGERAAVRFRFSIYDERGNRTERSGCAFAHFSNGTIVEWREYEA